MLGVNSMISNVAASFVTNGPSSIAACTAFASPERARITPPMRGTRGPDAMNKPDVVAIEPGHVLVHQPIDLGQRLLVGEQHDEHGVRDSRGTVFRPIMIVHLIDGTYELFASSTGCAVFPRRSGAMTFSALVRRCLSFQ
jgi:hypothetical protein